MPFIDDNNGQIAAKRVVGLGNLSEPELIGSNFKEQMRAAYSIDNTIGSLFAQESGLPDSDKDDKSFDIWGQLTDDEKLDERFVKNVMYADNTAEINAVRRQVDSENSKRAIMDEGGFLPSMLVSIVDPINLIPVGGTAYKTYRGGASILAAGMATAAASGVSAAATEGALHYSQLQRTYGESAVNITAATFLGGVLGASPIAIREMLTKSGYDADEALADISRTMDPEPRIAAGEGTVMHDGDLSSARVDSDAKVRGKYARAATKALGIDPLSQSITSDAAATRKAVNSLAENPLDMDKPLNQSVETAIKVQDGRYFEGVESHESAFLELMERDSIGGVGDAVTLKTSRRRKQFNEDVGKALRDGSDDPLVQKAADGWRAKLYDPIKDEAIAAKLLPEDVEVSTAAQYLNRIWNTQKMTANLPDFVATTSRWLMTKQDDLDLESAEDLAREIAGRIIGTPDGRLPYSYQIAENSSKGSGKQTGLKGAFKARSFDIPDKMVEDFLENDIEVLAGRYLKGTVPDIELVKRFGDVNMTAEIKDIEDDWLAKMAAAPTKKERAKLNKQKDRDIKNISAMRDRIRGTYGQVDHDNKWVRAARVARDLNYMRLLGGVVASSIPDVARMVAAEGFANVFAKGLKPLIANNKAFKVAAREAKLYGVGTDALMGGRAEIIADTADYAQGGTAFERAVRASATKFSSVNMMNQWTGGMKQLHAVVTQTRIAKELLSGGYDKRLGQLGIDEANAENIAIEMRNHGEMMDGVFVANSRNWSSQDLAMMWGGALRKESDRVIMVPGQEKPLFMSTELGKTVLQFKSFMFSATQRILISNLQHQDKYMFQGMIGMVGLGMLANSFKAWDAGRELSDDPKQWVMEGIDRSGMLGYLMEINNTLEKVSANNIGLRPLVGINLPASRYASRSVLDSVAGPTFGLLDTMFNVASATTGEGEWRESDTRALRRLLPAQNLSFLRQGIDELEKQL